MSSGGVLALSDGFAIANLHSVISCAYTVMYGAISTVATKEVSVSRILSKMDICVCKFDYFKISGIFYQLKKSVIIPPTLLL